MSEVNITLPDFDDMVELANKIKAKMLIRAELETEISRKESEIYLLVTKDSKYFTKDGKPPSATFIDKTYAYTGLEGELIPLRTAYGQVEAEISYLKTLFDVMKMQVDLYRTESANRRQTSL